MQQSTTVVARRHLPIHARNGPGCPDARGTSVPASGSPLVVLAPTSSRYVFQDDQFPLLLQDRRARSGRAPWRVAQPVVASVRQCTPTGTTPSSPSGAFPLGDFSNADTDPRRHPGSDDAGRMRLPQARGPPPTGQPQAKSTSRIQPGSQQLEILHPCVVFPTGPSAKPGDDRGRCTAPARPVGTRDCGSHDHAIIPSTSWSKRSSMAWMSPSLPFLRAHSR